MVLDSEIDAVWARWRTWSLMARQDIELRYRRSLLGPFWISFAMAVLIFGISLLYSEIFQIPFNEYVPFIATGLLVWTFLSGMVVEGCGVIIEAEHHLRSLRLPIALLAARSVYRNLIIFLHNAVVVVFIVAAINPERLPLISVFALLSLPVYLAFGLGASLILAPISTRFRDVPQFIASALQLVFFLTPIFWRPGLVGMEHPAVQLNPFYHLIELVRQPLLGHLPSATNWSVSLGFAAVLVVVGLFVANSTRRRIIFWL